MQDQNRNDKISLFLKEVTIATLIYYMTYGTVALSAYFCNTDNTHLVDAYASNQTNLQPNLISM